MASSSAPVLAFYYQWGIFRPMRPLIAAVMTALPTRAVTIAPGAMRRPTRGPTSAVGAAKVALKGVYSGVVIGLTDAISALRIYSICGGLEGELPDRIPGILWAVVPIVVASVRIGEVGPWILICRGPQYYLVYFT